MHHICHHAKSTPDAPAYIMAGSGETVTFKQLDERSNQIAHALRESGLAPSDTFAIFAENSARYYEVAWAAQRSGLYFTCISSRLTAPEVAYILEDSDSQLLLTTQKLASISEDAAKQAGISALWCIDGEAGDMLDMGTHRKGFPTTPVEDEQMGADMLYSSGTTGRPKGIRIPVPPNTPIDKENTLHMIASGLAGMGPGSIYISPAPLYHAAPLRWTMAAQSLGTCILVMEKFDPEEYLALVEKYKATHSQLVPTMFIRMLKLPEDVRKKYDVSSLKFAIHAAAPCPIPVKKQMLDWWGPIIYEYYAGSEGNGLTWVGPDDWLTHQGTVGKPVLGELRICDEDGNVLPVGEVGQIYFAGTAPPAYHNDPEKSAKARHPEHDDWSSLGDVGRVDEDGFLYLTDRKAFMIISGGVNIYPQEAENILITHPAVADVAVIGVPDEDFGEAVKAVVQTMPGVTEDDALRDELIAFCQSHLSKIKCPKSIDFDPELPRHATGKLYKRLIRDRYWGNNDSRIV